MSDKGRKSDYQLKTRNGYDLMEVRSALQKAIRRSQLERALYWAHELEPQYPAYLIYTLATVAAEDVGHYDTSLYAAINSTLCLWNTIFTERNKKKSRTEIRPALGSVIVMMCTARKKTRMADDAWMLVDIKKRQGWRIDIPEEALDEHVERGRSLKRGYKFWVRQSSQVHPRATSEELGVNTDFRAEVNTWYFNNSPIKNESDYNEWNPEDPDAPIEVIYKNGDDDE